MLWVSFFKEGMNLSSKTPNSPSHPWPYFETCVAAVVIIPKPPWARLESQLISSIDIVPSSKLWIMQSACYRESCEPTKLQAHRRAQALHEVKESTHDARNVLPLFASPRAAVTLFSLFARCVASLIDLCMQIWKHLHDNFICIFIWLQQLFSST